MIKETVITTMVTGALALSGYGVKQYADSTYVAQADWIQEKRRDEARELRDNIGEYEYVQQNERDLSPREKWQLQQWRNQLKEYESK